MADKDLMKVYKELPSWAKGVVVVGGLTVTYLAITSIIRAIKSKQNEALSKSEINQANKELNTQIQLGKAPTLQRSTLESMSNAIVNASNDCGTNNKLLLAQFDNLKNQADILLFIDVFGLRKKTRCPFSDDPRESFWSSQTPPMSLSSMIASELSASEIKTLNTKLASKGITYQF